MSRPMPAPTARRSQRAIEFVGHEEIGAVGVDAWPRIADRIGPDVKRQLDGRRSLPPSPRSGVSENDEAIGELTHLREPATRKIARGHRVG